MKDSTKLAIGAGLGLAVLGGLALAFGGGSKPAAKPSPTPSPVKGGNPIGGVLPDPTPFGIAHRKFPGPFPNNVVVDMILLDALGGQDNIGMTSALAAVGWATVSPIQQIDDPTLVHGHWRAQAQWIGDTFDVDFQNNAFVDPTSVQVRDIVGPDGFVVGCVGC
jgi:hypothetical protein